MKPQAQIIAAPDQTGFNIIVEQGDIEEQLDTLFNDYQDALDYILAQGWQLKREAPSSLHVETRFLKP